MSIAGIIERYQGVAFEWGRTDCCQFVGDCIEATTGKDLTGFFDYEDKLDAQEMIEDAGGLDRLVSTALGDPVEREPHDDDVVMVRQAGIDILGFVWNDVVLLRTPAGLVDWPLNKVETVWCLK